MRERKTAKEDAPGGSTYSVTALTDSAATRTGIGPDVSSSPATARSRDARCFRLSDACREREIRERERERKRKRERDSREIIEILPQTLPEQ